MVAYTTSTGTAPTVQQATRQNWNLGAGEVTQNQAGEYVYKDPVTGLYMKTPDRAFAEQQARSATSNQATSNVSTTTGLTDTLNTSAETADTTGGLNTVSAFTPNQRQLSNIERAVNQNWNLSPGQIAQNQAGEYIYKDPLTGIYMKTPNQQVAQYQSARDVTQDEFLDSTIVPNVGDWAQSAGVGTGFDWSGFNYNPASNIQDPNWNPNALNRTSQTPYSYSTYLNTIMPYSNAITPGAYGDYMSRITGGVTGANQSSSSFLDSYSPFTYSDTKSQSAVDRLDRLLNEALYTTSTTGGMGGYGGTTQQTLNINKLDKDLRPFIENNSTTIGRSGVSMLDALNNSTRNSILTQVSAKTGIPVDELTKLYNNYHYANKTYFDPTGAQWADLMQSGAAKDVISGIKDWSGSGSNISSANKIASRETLAREYTDKDFGVTADNPVKEITDSSGNTFYAVYNPTTGTQYIAADEATANTISSGGEGLTYDPDKGAFYGKKDLGEYIHPAYYYLNKPGEGITDDRSNITAINKMITIDDFLPVGVSLSNATPEQIADAQSALKGQQNLMKTWMNPTLGISDVGQVHPNSKLDITAESAPVEKDGRFYFVNDDTGKVTSVGNKTVADWASDPASNDTPLFRNGKYYYIDKDTGDIKSTTDEFLAQGESKYQNYLGAKSWEQFLPSGVNATNATPEQEFEAKKAFTAQQTGVQGLTGKGSVFNFFKSQDLPLPEDFIYFPSSMTRDFNSVVNMGINPMKVNPSLNPQNVYANSIAYDDPGNGMLGNFVTSFVVPALSAAYPGLAPVIQGLSGAYQLSQGNVLGGLASIAGATGLLNNVFGNALEGVKGSMSGALQNTFGLSAATSDKLVNAGLFAGAAAVNAALTDQNVLKALAAGAGQGYLANVISQGLQNTISNEGVRNFIATRLSGSVVNAIQGGKINLDEILASGLGTGLVANMTKKP